MSSSVASIARWQEEVRDLLPNLSRSQADGLGRLSYAMGLTGQCGLTRLCGLLAHLESRPMGRLRQQLREFYYEAEAKRGTRRREVEVEACFAPLLAGLLLRWRGEKKLVLALDASQMGSRFVVLSISVMYRGCGLPVAWTILAAHQKHGWNQEWKRLLDVLAPAVGADWSVLVLTDQGLYSAPLYRHIQRVGWHPMMRVHENLGIRGLGEEDFGPVGQRVNRAGRGWKGQGEWSEKGERMQGTVVIRWERGYEKKWVLVTDLEPKAVQAAWYQMRFWIEDEYKDHKRGGFHWEQTKMTDPKRAERLWLVMAVAMLRAVLIGGRLEAEEQSRARTKRQAQRGRPPKSQRRPRGREQSCLVRGQQAILAADLKAEALPLGEVMAHGWPNATYPIGQPSRSWLEKKRRREERRLEAKRRQRKRGQTAQAMAPPAQEVTPLARPASPPERLCPAGLVPVVPLSVQENPP